MANLIRNAAVAAAISAAGLTGAFNLADKYEGNSPTVYVDPVGIKTICRGTTSGPLIAKGKATPDECDKATLEDLTRSAAIVKSCMHGDMTQGEYNAWTSFANNVGPGAKGRKDGICRLKNGNVPQLVQRFNKGDHRAACKSLFDWTQPGTKIHNGILKRRTEEYAMCIRDLPRENSP